MSLRLLLRAVLLVGSILAPTVLLAQSAVFPGAEWEQAKNIEADRFSSQRLAALTPFLESLDTSALMVVAHGRVIYQYGDVKKPSYIASCRKSVLAMLYGNYVVSGKISLTRTLREMKFDDIGGLLPQELDATVEDVMTARSGVYHPASFSGFGPASWIAKARDLSALQQLGL